MILKKKTLKKNPSKFINEGEGEGREGEGRGRELKCYRQTYRHTDRHTDRLSDEAGPRGAFAPKNDKTAINITIFIVQTDYSLGSLRGASSSRTS